MAAASCSWLTLPVLLIVDPGAVLGLSWAVLGRWCTVLEFLETVLRRLGAVLGRSRAVLERPGSAGSAVRAPGTPPEARRPLSSQGLTSTIPYSHARGKIVCLVACLRAVLRAWLIACWLGSFLPDVPARRLTRVPNIIFACLPTCLLHRLLVRSRPLFAACCCLCLV